MPGFTSRDDLINEISVNGKIDEFFFTKTAPAAAQATGVWQSLWKGAGGPGAGGDPAATPGTMYDSDSASIVAGSMFFPDRSTDQKYLLSFGASASQSGTLMLYDRLGGVSGISLATTGAKTVNSGALTRYTGAAAINVQAWLEITTATTTTAPIVNLNQYTAADASTGNTGGNLTFPAAATVLHTMLRLPESATKQGIRSVEAGLNVGTAAAAGACNLLLVRPLAFLNIPRIGDWVEVSFLDDIMGLPRIYDNANLGLMFKPSSATTAAVVDGRIAVAYG